MPETSPVPVEQARSKYDWPTLVSRGWIFVLRDDALVNQAASIRNCARIAGLKIKIVVATHEGALGYMVTRKEG